MIKYLLSDKHRKLKFIISILILFSLSIYCYIYGKSELSLQQKVALDQKLVEAFPYLKVKTYKDDLVIMTDRWEHQWKIKWPKNYHRPPQNMYVSFMGKHDMKDVVYDIENIIIHKGYKVKLYISILALLPLFFYFALNFKYDKNGFYRLGN